MSETTFKKGDCVWWMQVGKKTGCDIKRGKILEILDTKPRSSARIYLEDRPTMEHIPMPKSYIIPLIKLHLIKDDCPAAENSFHAGDKVQFMTSTGVTMHGYIEETGDAYTRVYVDAPYYQTFWVPTEKLKKEADIK